MNKRESNTFRMDRAVDDVLTDKYDLVATVPALVDSHTRFSAKLVEIGNKDMLFSTDTTGKTISKHQAREELIDCMLPLMKGLYAYAVKKKETELKELFDISHSDLLRLNDEDLLKKVELTKSNISSRLSALGDYSITESKITVLDEKTAVLKSKMGAQNLGSTDKSADRKSLTFLLDEAEFILKEEIDPLMEGFKSTNREFYDRYTAARVIKDLGGSTGGGNSEQPDGGDSVTGSGSTGDGGTTGGN